MLITFNKNIKCSKLLPFSSMHLRRRSWKLISNFIPGTHRNIFQITCQFASNAGDFFSKMDHLAHLARCFRRMSRSSVLLQLNTVHIKVLHRSRLQNFINTSMMLIVGGVEFNVPRDEHQTCLYRDVRPKW